MDAKTDNEIIAEALAFYMADTWNQTTLAAASGVAANTIGNTASSQRGAHLAAAARRRR